MASKTPTAMIKNALKRELRSMQTFFPGLRQAKFDAYNWATRNLGWRIEPEFRLLAHLPKCDIAIDVGGNRGQSILALKRCANPSKIIGFEPNAALASSLADNFAGDDTVTIHPIGLGSETGAFQLHIPSYRNFEYDGLASLDRSSAIEWLNADRVARFDPSLLKIATHAVKVERLDDFNLTPDVIKIDVQGLEQAVVQGGFQTIAQHRPAIIIEAPSHSLIELLKTAGLKSYIVGRGKLHQSNDTHRNNMFLSDENYGLISDSLASNSA
ncbi:MAG: FkbM family methyltransferase [Erythrobacter sp.]